MTFADNGNGTGTLSDSSPLGGSFTVELQATNTTTQVNTTDQIVTVVVKSKYPAIRHVFVIMLENNRYSATFGSPSADPYLATTLPSEGALLEKYYGVGHFSNDNYVGFISGQPPNTDNQLDCLGSGFVDFPVGVVRPAAFNRVPGVSTRRGVTTLANQLDSAGFTWKGYMEDMGNDPTRDGGVTCGHPAVGASSDPTTSAEAGDGYTTRHDPFVYFHSIIDNATECDTNVVPLGDTSGNMPAGTPARVTGLATDLQSVATTPNVSFITPNLCDDGHDYPCTNTTGAGTGWGLLGRRHQPVVADLGTDDHLVTCFQAGRTTRDHLRRGRGAGSRRHGSLRRDAWSGSSRRRQRRERSWRGCGRGGPAVALHQGRHEGDQVLQPLLLARDLRGSLQPSPTR